jgi:hypothetical protein
MSEPLSYNPLSSDILQNDRKLRVVLTGPQRPLVDVNLAGERHRRLGATGLHYDPVGHSIIADFGHLLFGHSPLQSAVIEPVSGRVDVLLSQPAKAAMQSKGSMAFICVVPPCVLDQPRATRKGRGGSQGDDRRPQGTQQVSNH